MGPEKQPQELTMLIDKLVGTWDVEMTVKLVDGAILRGKGKLKAQEIVDGFGVPIHLFPCLSIAIAET